MSGLAIPNDWEEAQDGFCTLTITVPNSPMWRASVNGAVSNLAYEKSWDKDTAESAGGGGTFDGQVATGFDDAEQKDSGASFSNSSVQSTSRSAGPASQRWNSGHRFQNVAIPQGATINAAYISVTPVDANNDDPNVQIHAEAIDNAPDFNTVADVTNRVRSTAFTQWTQAGIGTGEVNSPDISPVISEIVNRPGWLSGNAMVIILAGKSDVTNEFAVIAYDGTPASAVKLHVEWQLGQDTSPSQAAIIGQDILDSIITDCP